jgi:hypothetical protein
MERSREWSDDERAKPRALKCNPRDRDAPLMGFLGRELLRSIARCDDQHPVTDVEWIDYEFEPRHWDHHEPAQEEAVKDVEEEEEDVPNDPPEAESKRPA